MPLDGLGPPRALGRQREAGGVLLRARVRLHAGRLRRPGDRASATAPRTCSSRARSGSCYERAARRQRDRPLRVHARRRRPKDIALRVPDAGDGLPRGGRSAARASVAEPHWVEDEHGRVELADDRDLRRERPHLRQPRRLRGPVPARLRLARAERPRRSGVGLQRDRPRRRQRRARADERLGRVLRARVRDDEHHPLRRRADPDRVLGADVEGDGGRRAARSSSRSTSRPRASARARSRSTSSSTAAPASSTSRSSRRTSCARSRR